MTARLALPLAALAATALWLAENPTAVATTATTMPTINQVASAVSRAGTQEVISEGRISGMGR